jgi:hypothetical protein
MHVGGYTDINSTQTSSQFGITEKIQGAVMRAHETTLPTWRSFAASLTLCLPMSSAHALVEAGHWSFSQNSQSTWGDNFSVSIDQTPAGDHTGTFYDYNFATGTLTFLTKNIDESSEVWIASAGQVIDNQYNKTINTSKPVFVGNDFYLGAATSSSTDPGFNWGNLTDRTSFGWAHFKADATGKLTLLGSAMAFREPAGIIVGTLTTPVPEPGTWALMGLGLCALGSLRLRRPGQATRLATPAA